MELPALNIKCNEKKTNKWSVGNIAQFPNPVDFDSMNERNEYFMVRTSFLNLNVVNIRFGICASERTIQYHRNL